MRFVQLCIMVLFLGIHVPLAPAQEAGTSHALLIGGLGGTEAYTQTFRQYLFETRQGLVNRHGFDAAHVTVLGEAALANESFVDGLSDAETIRSTFARLQRTIGANDRLYVILFGHGSYSGQEARLNIPRRDLSAQDFAGLLDGIVAARIVFINTAPCSAPFIDALAGPDRIVMTATRSGSQSNETRFPIYLVEALGSPNVDLDKDGRLSVREWFVYAAEHTNRSFEADGNLPTENALLEDTGDAKGQRVTDLESTGEGNLAGITYLHRQTAIASVGNAAQQEAATDMLRQKEDLEANIAALRSQKAGLAEDRYYAELETLFVRLARLNARLETLGQQP